MGELIVRYNELTAEQFIELWSCVLNISTKE